MMRSRMVGVALGLAGCGAALGQAMSAAEQDRVVRINQIQVIGSHNSYHAGFAPSERKFLEKVAPKALSALDYSHATLSAQLTGGVRQLEIDVFRDSKGGRFAHPKIVRQVAEAGLPTDPDFDPEHEMDKPGLKVMHVQDVDERSRCHTLVKCLTEVRAWSKAHPGHLPLFLLIETKEGPLKGRPDAVETEPFTPAAFDELDGEIRSVFTVDEMIVPDQVRGKAATLPEAIQAGGWPTLASARGKVVFLMDQRPAEARYVLGHPALRGRVLFTNAPEGAPDAAFTEENSGSAAEIDALVKKGYLVRTRSDEPTEQARKNDTARRDLVLGTGAQMISTDYPLSEPAAWTGYSVGLPGGLVARCNPANKPAGCVDGLLEQVGAQASR
jgi:Phosphoinositide phospholipase C, Ca2+-dependent